jgi:hypothetical protein
LHRPATSTCTAIDRKPFASQSPETEMKVKPRGKQIQNGEEEKEKQIENKEKN